MGGRPSRLVHGGLRRWGRCPPAAWRRRCGAAGRLGPDRASRGHPRVRPGRAGEGQGRRAGCAGV
eukprot:15430611-Alexandrium_andersonii.AAC.1